MFVGGRANSILRLRRDRKRLFSWRNFFIILDRLMHWAEAVHMRPVRTIALRKAEKWMLERLEMTDGLGAIYPAMLNAIIALRCLGYSATNLRSWALSRLPVTICPNPRFACSRVSRLSGTRHRLCMC